jgi:hypothetical protein
MGFMKILEYTLKTLSVIAFLPLLLLGLPGLLLFNAADKLETIRNEKTDNR